MAQCLAQRRIKKTRSILERCVRPVGYLVAGVLFQAAGGCDFAATLNTIQQDIVKGVSTGLGNLSQVFVLNLAT